MVTPYSSGRDPNATTGTEYCSRCGQELGALRVWLQPLNGGSSEGPMHQSCSMVQFGSLDTAPTDTRR